MPTANRRLLCLDIVDDHDVTEYDAKARERLEIVPVFLLELVYLDKTTIFFVMEQNNYMYTGTLHVPITYESGGLWLNQPARGLKRLRRIVISLRTVSLCTEVHLLI
jgi:hypothetical protein